MFLSILTVILFILGITLGESILFIIAGLLLAMVIGSLVWMMRRRSKKEASSSERERTASPPEANREKELKNLGIMEIRRKGPDNGAQPAPAGTDDASSAPTPPSEKPAESTPEEHPPPQDRSGPKAAMAPVSEEATAPSEEKAQEETSTAAAERPSSQEAGTASPVETAPAEQDAEEPDVLSPYLQALRAAVRANTVCLLKQEDLALEYDIEALVSANNNVQREGRFSTKTPLLTAGMTQRPVTVQRVGEMALPTKSLGYYHTPNADVHQVMLAPVTRPDDPASYFLLADTTAEGRFNANRPCKLAAQFARLLAVLLDKEEDEAARQDTDDIRPRREIISEEMEAAREHEQPLALALIYLNRAEALSDEGESAVTAAEQTLKKRLDKHTERGRIERFGELTYGVFYRGTVGAVEAWAGRVQGELAEEMGRLEGGISIGIAMLNDRHETPNALRDDATEALREAYKTGTSTILE